MGKRLQAAGRGQMSGGSPNPSTATLGSAAQGRPLAHLLKAELGLGLRQRAKEAAEGL